METAISIPDPLFKAADAIAQRLGLSRSELYTRALQTFIAAHDKQYITEALNQVYSENPSSIDPTVTQMQIASLLHEDW
jgi:metal-responsive CopG/Arc/MetJ family transcriptional regulator